MCFRVLAENIRKEVRLLNISMALIALLLNGCSCSRDTDVLIESPNNGQVETSETERPLQSTDAGGDVDNE